MLDATTNSVLDQALELPARERAVVAEQILLSLDKPDAELDAVWASEAESRLSAYKSGREPAISLADIFKTS
ncbi:addiction module protein [Parahaliea mediterranea]|uniref:addiction module protein n=1 Tax=Parahaliea mediterranea TaxID=651086 RepID=UPI000E2EF7E6